MCVFLQSLPDSRTRELRSPGWTTRRGKRGQRTAAANPLLLARGSSPAVCFPRARVWRWRKSAAAEKQETTIAPTSSSACNIYKVIVRGPELSVRHEELEAVRGVSPRHRAGPDVSAPDSVTVTSAGPLGFPDPTTSAEADTKFQPLPMRRCQLTLSPIRRQATPSAARGAG